MKKEGYVGLAAARTKRWFALHAGLYIILTP
jgi:hypothetical protein